MNELQNRPIESLFEELENITLPTTEVNELVTDLNNIVMDQLTWRSVEDGLPDEGQEVLTISIAGTKDVTFLLNDGTWDNTLLITHWLPIPKLNG